MTKKERVLVCRVTRDDCEWTYARGSGPGGQHRNKTATVVTVKHPSSGAIGHAGDSRSQWQNRQAAWRRMAESPEFQRWLRIQAGHSAVTEAQLQREVQAMLAPEHIKVEVRKNGRWVEESA